MMMIFEIGENYTKKIMIPEILDDANKAIYLFGFLFRLFLY